MSKKSLLHIFVCLSVLLFAAALQASAGSQKKEPSAEEIKKRVEKYGLGQTARVKVKLRNGAKMEGFVDSAGDDHFYLVRTDEEKGTGAVIAYDNVAQIEGNEKSLVNWRKVAERTGTGAGAVLSVLRSLYLQVPGIGPKFTR